MDVGRQLAAEIDSLVIRNQLGAAGTDDEEWRALIENMAAVRSSRYSVLGRPAFVTDRWLQRLVSEAQGLRSGAQPSGTHAGQAGQWSASPGQAARMFALHRGWRETVQRTFEFEPRPPYHAIYLYYDSEGAGIVPHVDDPEFAVNVLLMLSRDPAGGDGSATVLHPPERSPVRVVLQPGEAVLLEADGLVHAREPLRQGERVTLLSMGFTRPDYSPSTA